MSAAVTAVPAVPPGSVEIHPDPLIASYCLVHGLSAVDQPWGIAPPPWARGRREEVAQVVGAGAAYDGSYCLAEVDIFADLSAAEMEQIAAAAPMRSYALGELLFSPRNPTQTLFILKRGRVRVFRVSSDGRALTTALLTPGMIFGEMVQLGQQMYDSFAEALEESVVCVMSREDVQRFLLSDPRIAARITAILGTRLVEMERRLSDTVFKSVPQRLAGTLLALTGPGRRLGFGSHLGRIELTHEQLAAMVGTSRETATKVLGEFAERGLIKLARGRVSAGPGRYRRGGR